MLQLTGTAHDSHGIPSTMQLKELFERGHTVKGIDKMAELLAPNITRELPRVLAIMLYKLAIYDLGFFPDVTTSSPPLYQTKLANVLLLDSVQLVLHIACTVCCNSQRNVILFQRKLSSNI